MFDVRCPTPADDLSALWPEPVLRHCNREQMLVVVQDSQPLAGCFLWDGGHGLVFVSDFRVLPGVSGMLTAVASKRLLSGILSWCQARGRAGILLQTSNLAFATTLLRLGAHSCGVRLLVTLDAAQNLRRSRARLMQPEESVT